MQAKISAGIARLGILGSVLVAVTGLTACSTGIPEGDSLSGRARGAFGLDSGNVGGHYGFSFPLIFNVTDHLITINRVRVTHVPAGIRVTGYRAIKDVDGVLAVSVEGTGGRDDYLSYRNLYSPGAIQLKPHSFGGLYFAADVTITQPGHHRISGCQIIYTTSDRTRRQQTFRCMFELGTAPAHAGG